MESLLRFSSHKFCGSHHYIVKDCGVFQNMSGSISSKGRCVHFSGVWDSGPPINFPYEGGAVLIPTLFYSGENTVN